MIEYNEITKQIDIPFPAYQKEILFPAYGKTDNKVNEETIPVKNPSQLELALK